jgi:hypothetical protein
MVKMTRGPPGCRVLVVLVSLREGGGSPSPPSAAVSFAQTRTTTRRLTSGGYPGRAGGPWLWSTLVLSGFQALVVPSGFRTRVQPHLWMTT